MHLNRPDTLNKFKSKEKQLTTQIKDQLVYKQCLMIELTYHLIFLLFTNLNTKNSTLFFTNHVR